MPLQRTLNDQQHGAKALLVTTLGWPSAAKLAMALGKGGFSVAVVARAAHLVRKVRAVDAHYLLGSFAPPVSIANAIADWAPDILVPCDDPAVDHLHALHKHAVANRRSMVVDLIERSLGDPRYFAITARRSAFSEVAASAPCAMPETMSVRDEDDLRAKIARATFPQVLKSDFSWGGRGTWVTRSPDEALSKFSSLIRPLDWPRTVKRALVEKDPSAIVTRAKHTAPRVILQRYIEGQPANRAVVCWRGEVLAGLSVAALHVAYENGPATMVRIVEHDEMARIASRFVRELQISGYCGFDFVIERNSGRAFLIEMNPRATPVCHLSVGKNRDLISPLFAKLTAVSQRSDIPVVEGDTVALFPNEWWRDPSSAYLQSAYHDVPWEEPDFVRACLVRPRSGWLDRLWNRAASRFPVDQGGPGAAPLASSRPFGTDG